MKKGLKIDIEVERPPVRQMTERNLEDMLHEREYNMLERKRNSGSRKKSGSKPSKMPKNKIVTHLKGDIKDFKREMHEDMALIKEMKKQKRSSIKKPSVKKFERVMREFGENTLHSGSKKGPKVKSKRQALAIAFSQAKKSKKKRGSK